MEIIKTDFFDGLEDDNIHNEDWAFANENVEAVAITPQKRKRETSYKETDLSFGDLGLAKPLVRACDSLGFLAPTKIQADSIPILLKGSDAIICAQTGCGKTGAFSLPILHKLLYRNKRLQVTRFMILSPTRELSQQISSMMTQFCRLTDLTCKVVIGGASSAKEAKQLQSGPDVLIATPGRVLDHIKNSKDVSFDHLSFLVIDEADKLLEMGFVNEVKEILKELPPDRQTILASATMNVESLASVALKRPVKIGEQKVPSALKHLLVRMKEDWNRDAVFLYILEHCANSNVLVFYKTKADCHKMFVLLRLLGYKVAEVHGNLRQAERLKALREFQAEEVNVLLATDLVARGLDLPVSAVVNVNFPDTPEKLLHRIGRTARAGKEGLNISLVNPEERTKLRKILKTSVPALKIDPVKLQEANAAIEKHKHKVKITIAQEKVDKELEIAEREAQKGENLIKYKDEIYNRPKKEWIKREKTPKKRAKSEDKAADKRIESKVMKNKLMIRHYKTAAKGLKMMTKKKPKKK